MYGKWIIAAVLLLGPIVAGGQASPGVNPVYLRAQMLVNDGNAAAGRALVDSMIAVAAPGSNEYAEGVYWRAVLAATAADAEMDYRRLVVDFPGSPRVGDALIRLAQLEIARANYDGALRHLNRLIAEHPESPLRPRAGYWMARAMFDKNDLPGGCAAIADALARTSEGDAELRNQITYLNQRCAGIPPAGMAPPAVSTTGAVAPAVVPPPAAPPVDSSRTTAVVPPAPPPVRPAPPPAAPPVRDTTRPPTTRQPDAILSRTTPTGAPVQVWSVQVAAYNARSQADAMVARLKTNGYEARVDGSAAPYRVRIGRYATQGQASAVQRSLKAKKIDGFVVQAEAQ
jgi:DedD protein